MGSTSFSPTAWSNYFQIKEDVQIDQDTFRIYRQGYEGVLLFCIHGGGFSGLSWASFCKNITAEVKCQCMAVDVRGHGDTFCSDETDLSIDKLTNDIIEVILSIFPTEAPPIILIGHSMGGAIAINVAALKRIPSLHAVCVIDVVEGSAMQTLNSMRGYLLTRPSSFKTINEGILWSHKSSHIRNLKSARVSFPGQIKCISTNQTGTQIIEKTMADSSTSKEEINVPDQLPNSPEFGPFTWRIDLSKTHQFWKGWFEGMSRKFLSITEPKLLILAGVDRLDKDLCIAQMQGKFQVEIMQNAGHVIHEDNPEGVSEIISKFLIRNRFTEARSNIDYDATNYPRQNPTMPLHNSAVLE